MKSWIFPMLWLTFSSFLLLIRESHTSGQISVRFKSYDNSGGKGSNGHCCDGRWIICGSACDHQFTVCLDRRYGSQDLKSCPLGSRQTGEMVNQDSITFGSSIDGVKNPMLFKVDSVPDGMLVKIDVWDVDDNSHDHVDYLSKTVALNPWEPRGTEKTAVLSGRTNLITSISSYCDPDFYGSACHILCKAYPGDHFSCEPKSGQKICQAGWTTDDCSVSIDDCVAHKCENYATCVDRHMDYMCVCPTGFTGRYCEKEVLECLSDPCINNGTCIDGLGLFHCNCTEGWTGLTCEINIDDCLPETCQNNATCSDQHNGYLCECTDGWTGQNCEIDIDECRSNPCIGPATCIDALAAFECVCDTGYRGELCQVQIDECVDNDDNVNPCEHNSTCRDTDGGYTCQCAAGYTGRNCETNINECAAAADVCHNGAVCLDFVNDFRCVCMHGWTGPTCSERDLCLENVCSRNATCIERHDTYECVCSVGWGGPLCDVKMIPCVLNACSNNGTCYQRDPETNSQGHFTCICPEDWTGPTCEIPMSLYLQTTPQPPGSNSAEIFLIGDIDAIDVALVKEDLMSLLSHQVELAKEHLDIDVELKKMSADDEVNVVRVLATASTKIPEAEVKLEDLQMSWEEIPQYIVDRDMSYPVYRGQFKEEADRNPENAPTVNWAHSNWYIIVLVVIVSLFVAFLILVAILILRRRAQKLCPMINIGHPVPVSPDHSSTPRPDSETELTPQPIRKGEQSYHNQLYMGYHFTSGEDST